MNCNDLRLLLEQRRAAFDAQLVAINDELAALGARARELEKVLLQTMGQKNEAVFLLDSIKNSARPETGGMGGNP